MTARQPLVVVAGRRKQLPAGDTIPKALVGLGSVDNTSDLAKPISTATQGALDGKQPIDSDLTAIAVMTPTNGDTLLRVAGAWVNRTMAQLSAALGLGTAATANVTTSTADTTADRVLRVADHGVGALVLNTGALTNINDINLPTGFYGYANGATGAPAAGPGVLHVERFSNAALRQIARPVNGSGDSNAVFERQIRTGPVYGAWVTVSHSGNVNATLAAIIATPSAFILGRSDLGGAVNIDTVQVNGAYSLALCSGTKPVFEADGTVMHWQHNSSGDAYQECLGFTTGYRRFRYRTGSTWTDWAQVVLTTNPQIIYGSCSYNGTGTPVFLVNTASFSSVTKTATGTCTLVGSFGVVGVNAPVVATSVGLTTKLNAAPGAAGFVIVTSAPTTITVTDAAFVGVIVGKTA